MKFAFVERGKAAYPVEVLCRVLKVLRSGSYASLRRKECECVKQDRKLRVLRKEAHERSRRNYGSIRIHKALKKQGVFVSRNRVVRLMQLEGIAGKRRRRWTRTTDSQPGVVAAPNILNREFTPDGPNKSWAGDVTFLRTPFGFVYLAVVIDLSYSPDPASGSNGILNSAGDVCCALSCGACGGNGCGDRLGGSESCCAGAIREAGTICAGVAAPCMVP